MSWTGSIRQYETDGCVRIRGFFDAPKLAAVRRELNRYMSVMVPVLPPDDRTWKPTAKPSAISGGWSTTTRTSIGSRMTHDPPVCPRSWCAAEPVLMAVETFNKPARVGSGVPPHQDNAYFCQAPPDVLTIWIAIDAVTEANGPVFYLKGSHRDGTLPHRPSGVAGNSMGLVKCPQMMTATSSAERSTPATR